MILLLFTSGFFFAVIGVVSAEYLDLGMAAIKFFYAVLGGSVVNVYWHIVTAIREGHF